MIGSHIIPAFYLKQFSAKLANKKHFVWVYEKSKDPVQRNIQKQGKQNGYFAVLQEDGRVNDEDSEREMARLESECNEALLCARSELFDWSSSKNKNRLAFYAGLLYARATQRRSHSELVSKSVNRQLAACADDPNLMQEIADAINTAALQQAFTPDLVRQMVLERAQEGSQPTEVNTHFVTNLRGLADYFSTLLLRKKWQVWRAPRETEFITSDNPVINFIALPHGPFHPGHGFNKGMTAFPLAPDACLIMGLPVGVPESRRVDTSVIDRMNTALISICDRYVYSKTCLPSIQNVVQRDGGMFRYGENALLPIGMKVPTVREVLRRQYGLPPENN